MDENFSSNYGTEGETDNSEIQLLRLRQAKNFFAILFLSIGVPMLLSGDEVLRTQKGNNNCWCQDNELSWLDWRLVEKNADMLRFTREMIAFRKRHPCLMRRSFLTGRKAEGREFPDIVWHGTKLHAPLWNDPDSRFLAYTMSGMDEGEEDLHVIINMEEEVAVDAMLPETGIGRWFLAIDTFNKSPGDIVRPSLQKAVGRDYPVNPRSIVVFERRLPENNDREVY